MKDGKPEVLIIGETHPVLLYSINLPPKHSTINFGKISKDIVVPDIFVGDAEKLIEAVRVPSTILKAEISWIKDFGAQRILYEFVDNTQTRKICKKLGKTKNLAKFQKAILLVSERIIKNIYHDIRKFCARYKAITTGNELPIPWAISKIVPFIISGTRVFDILFFDDAKLYRKKLVYGALLGLHEQGYLDIESPRLLSQIKSLNEKTYANIK